MGRYPPVTGQPRDATGWDMASILEIEQVTSDNPWDASCFARHKNELSTKIVVWDAFDGYLVAFAVYRYNRDVIDVLKLAVRPKLCRTGIGTMVIGLVK